MEQDKYLSVSAITRYLKYKFDSDAHLNRVFLRGEISNFKAHTTGHFYFSLKDEQSKINAIMFRGNASKVLFTPMEGMKVLVIGRITVYEATGGYQIYVEDMQEDGIGNLYIAFEQLKAKLASEGLFDEKHKKAIPKIPSRIGIVTASTGAAIKDILSTIKRRYPLCETILFPALVQGDAAAADIARKIKLAEQYDIDTLIVGRGGGSIEDLWPFNEEIVARAIYECTIPVISAVGHEIDYTIADFVADLRAPTPTGAAEIAVPHVSDLETLLSQLQIRLKENIYKKVNYNKLYLESVKNSFVIKNPMIMYENKKQQLDVMLDKINGVVMRKLELEQYRLDKLKKNYLLQNPKELYSKNKIQLGNLIEKLELLNPLGVLKRGYALPYVGGEILKSVQNVQVNDLVVLKLHDGEIDMKVEQIKEEKHG